MILISSTLEKIEQAAFSLFSKKGYEGTSMNDIAQKVGISKPSIYFYFKSKEELYFRIVNNQVDQYFSALSLELESNKDAPEDRRLFNLFLNHVEFFLSDVTRAGFFVNCIFLCSKEVKEKLLSNNIYRDLDTALRDYILDIYKSGLVKGIFKDIEHTTFLLSFFWFINSYEVRIVNYGEHFDKKKLEEDWQLYFEGLVYRMD